jgi:hypothetical protein
VIGLDGYPCASPCEVANASAAIQANRLIRALS